MRSPSPGGIRSRLGSDVGAVSLIIAYAIHWLKGQTLAGTEVVTTFLFACSK
jgi:hypothetical protein